MAEEVFRQVPYQIDILASDLASGRRVGNTLYYMNTTAGGYAVSLASSDNTTMLSTIWANWWTYIAPVLSEHWASISVRQRAIMGWKWPTPYFDVIGVTPGLTNTSIATGTPHNFTTGGAVSITGTAGVTGLNAVWSPITVTGSTTFTVPVVLSGSLSVVGKAQFVKGVREFTYEQNYEILDGLRAGGIADEALPLYCAASVRRINIGVGRNWKSRISLGPIGESQALNGRFDDTAFATFETAIDNLNNQMNIGGGFNVKPCVVSRTLAFQQATPFTDSSLWTNLVSDHATRKNLGSLIARKPRLTSVIA